ncbi:MAG: deoxyribose-phosphate aldolase [Firmicutes bacterium]|nr:deoxyribose-phosphate aldolase [Bacillota bacterium]
MAQTATENEIIALCGDAVRYKTASVCIPPAHVRLAAGYLKGRVPVCTVIGFPNGYSTTAAKVFETEDAVKNGADEIDMVINIGMLKDKKYDLILNEINRVKYACGGRILKVIIETCLLTEDEKIKMCEIISASGADYIKTSTGFSTGGATADDIKLFKAHTAPPHKIKAAGGISSLEDAEEFINLGADRLGTSRIVKIAKERE